MEAKILLFDMLSNFSICEKTPKNVTFVPGFAVFELIEKIFVEFKPRQ